MNRRNFITLSIFGVVGLPLLASGKIPSFTAHKSEWEKCKNSPIYFIENYVYINTLNDGKKKLALFDFQRATICNYHKYSKNVVVNARQMGISTISTAYALWEMIFTGDSNILIVSHSHVASRCIRDKFAFMYQNLPQTLQPRLVRDNINSIEFDTGAKISFRSSMNGMQFVRGESLSAIVVDDAAYCDNVEEMGRGIFPQVRSTGKIILTSALNQPWDWFHAQYLVPKGTNAKHSVLDWTKHPNRDLAWKSHQVSMLGKKEFAREYECKFIT